MTRPHLRWSPSERTLGGSESHHPVLLYQGERGHGPLQATRHHCLARDELPLGMPLGQRIGIAVQDERARHVGAIHRLLRLRKEGGRHVACTLSTAKSVIISIRGMHTQGTKPGLQQEVEQTA